MTTSLYKKGLVLAIIGLFIGAGIVPSISGDINDNENTEIKDYVDVVSLPPDDELDQQQPETDPSSGGYAIWLNGTHDGHVCAQSFKPTLSILTRVELFVAEWFNDMECDLIVEIRGTLDGNNITFTSVPSNIIPAMPDWEWIFFDFPDISVTPGDTYYIIAKCNCGSWNEYMGVRNIYGWRSVYDTQYISGDAYGYLFYEPHTEPSWELYIDEDYCFKTYGYSSNLEVRILGGFRVSAIIKNNGTATASDIDWSIELDGGFMLMGGSSDGTITELATGESETIRLDSLFGIGNTVITVTAGDATKQAAGFILGPLVLNVQEI